MNRTAELKDNLVEMRFDYSPELIGLIKNEVPGRRWNPNDKCWTAPFSDIALLFLEKQGFSLCNKILQYKQEQETKEIKTLALPKGLYNFQKTGVSTAISKFNNRALIADKMGLGKTIQALAWLYCQPELRPALLIVPASAKINWQRKGRLWLKEKGIVILSGMEAKEDIPANPNIIICNYTILEILKREKGETVEKYRKRKASAPFLHHELKKIKFKALICDEIHYIANEKTRRTKIVRSIAKRIKNILTLSGTPITSRPVKFFPILNMLKPELFPSSWHYKQEYCGAVHGEYGWDFSGSSNTEKLHKILTNYVMIRRTKEDVIADLPEKIRDIVPLEITNRREYELADADFVGWLNQKGETEKADKAKNAKAFSRIEGLKQLCLKGKSNAVIDWIEDFLQEGDDKLVVFCHHVEFRKRLYKKFKAIAVEAPGGAANQKAEDIFQANPRIRLFIGSIQSANVVLTLTAASHMAIIELPWTPGDLEQAEERIYARLNDMHGANIYLLVAMNTIEEDIAKILDKKTKTLSKVLDGKDTEEDSLIIELLKKYKNE